MAMPLPLKDCYERRVQSFSDQFASASSFPSSGAVHDMRVSLKRLRTFFNLAESINSAFDGEKAFAPARKLFRAAGKVRNLHVVEAKAREAVQAAFLELSEYYNWLKEEERREDKKFSRACRRFHKNFFALAWPSLCLEVEGPAASRVGEGVENRLLALIREIKEKPSAQRGLRRLHFLRTRTKEARYALEIMQECGLTGDEGRLLNDRLRDVHQSLGRWHDEEVVLSSLREFRKLRTPGPFISFKSYAEFSRRVRAQKVQSLSDFEAAWAAFLEFLAQRPGRRFFQHFPGRRG